MKNLIFRIITALVLLPIVIFALIQGGLTLALLLGLVSLIGCLEAASIIDAKNIKALSLTALFWVGTFWALAFLDLEIFLSCTAPMLLIFNSLVLFSKTIDKDNFQKLCAIFSWCFYLCFGISTIFWLSASVSIEQELGRSFIFLACLCTWANDTFAYFGGRLMGKNYLYPRVSGKKTWEGFITGSICSIILALLIKYIPETFFGHQLLYGLTYQDILWVSIPSVFLAPIGDLIESRFKRLYDKKDSSQILPGHGGLLDRIDSLLLVMPWTALYAFIIRGLC